MRDLFLCFYFIIFSEWLLQRERFIFTVTKQLTKWEATFQQAQNLTTLCPWWKVHRSPGLQRVRHDWACMHMHMVPTNTFAVHGHDCPGLGARVHYVFCATTWSNFRKSGRHISSCGTVASCDFHPLLQGIRTLKWGWALSSLQPWRVGRILSAYLCENCLNKITPPTCISPASSSVKQETQPPKSKHQTSSLKNENKFSNPKAVCFCDWKSFS